MEHRVTNIQHFLTSSTGRGLCSSAEAVLKGCLESDTPVHLVTGPEDSWFGALLRLRDNKRISSLLKSHETRLVSSFDAYRAVSLAINTAKGGRRAVAAIPNESLQTAMTLIAAEASGGFPAGGAAFLLIEDDPCRFAWPSPRRLLSAADIACLEVVDLQSLRLLIESGLILSRADRKPVGGIVHTSIAHSLETLECQPNRIVESTDVDAILRRRRRRRIRFSEDVDVLRAARRLELNNTANLPSPGERAEIGFILVGPASGSIRYLLHNWELVGRIPILELGLIHPADDSAIGRLLDRCNNAIVIETRPGETEAMVLAVAERMRHRGEHPASVWGKQLPPVQGVEANFLSTDDALSPSILAQRLRQLLQNVHPAKNLSDSILEQVSEIRIPTTEESTIDDSNSKLHQQIRNVLYDVDKWLSSRAPLENYDLKPTSLWIDGTGKNAPRSVFSEIWTSQEFFNTGRSALQQAATDDSTWVFLVSETDALATSTVNRFVQSCLGSKRSRRAVVESVSLTLPAELREAIRNACLQSGITVLIVHQQKESTPLGDVELESIDDIDKQGFRRVDHLLQHVEDTCSIRPTNNNVGSIPAVLTESADGVSYSIDKLPKRLRGHLRVRLRPIWEWVEVVRSKPPMLSLATDQFHKIPPPQIIHGHQPSWRIHFAGTRGEAPGIAVQVLCKAGQEQGYRVRCGYSHTKAGSGRSSWAQVTFSSDESTDQSSQLSMRIPYGKADLLLGTNIYATEVACAADSHTMVAHASRTYAVVDLTGGIDDSDQIANKCSEAVEDAMRNVIKPNENTWIDISRLTHIMFGTSRPTDLVLLGFAFQRGFIPISIDAINSSIERMQNKGYLHCDDAFRLGRYVAVSQTGLVRKQRYRELAVKKMIRYAELSLRADGGRYRRIAVDYGRIVRHGIDVMPGLAESEAGRQAQRDFVDTVERCIRWGGINYARHYRDLIVDLYKSDRGDYGRALTRHAILPLAEVMLIRDNWYLATMTTSAVSKRAIRRRLNVKASMGDVLNRRFLNRLEFVLWTVRLRFEFRSSDWLAVLSRRIGTFLPNNWRGTGIDRERRQYVIELLQKSNKEAATNYERYNNIFMVLHKLAVSGQLRHLSAASIKDIVQQTDAGIEELAISAITSLSDLEDEDKEKDIPILNI